jgi:hypothetical protein
LQWYRLLRLGVGGVGIVLLGIWLLTSPVFRDNPNVFTLKDAMPGIGALFVGLLVLAATVVSAIWR